MQKLGSRKLWITLSALATIVVAAVSGEMTWAEAAPSLAGVAAAYCATQGWVDGKAQDKHTARMKDDDA